MSEQNSSDLRERREMAEDLTPDAIEAAKTQQKEAALARARDAKARGVDWVRPTDLMARHAATVAGRGIDFQAELARKTRHGIAVGTKAVGTGAKKVAARVAKLPPLSAFGRRTRTTPPVTRGPVGKS